jgi:hypothetical protein
MDGDACDDERDAGRLHRARNLAEHDDADHGRSRRQERDEKRVGRAPHPRHRKLVGDVRDDRRRDPDPRARREQERSA